MNFRKSLPISIVVESASPSEVKLVQETIDNVFIKNKPKKIVGDKLFDIDPLDEKLRKRNVELIAPLSIYSLIIKACDRKIFYIIP